MSDKIWTIRFVMGSEEFPVRVAPTESLAVAFDRAVAAMAARGHVLEDPLSTWKINTMTGATLELDQLVQGLAPVLLCDGSRLRLEPNFVGRRRATIVFIINGEDVHVRVDQEESLRAARDRALTESWNTGRPFGDWDIRAESGKLLAAGSTVASNHLENGARLLLSLRMGAGGATAKARAL